MADRIKGITIEIGGDTTGLSKALKGVNGEIRTAETGLKDVEKLLKLDPGNVDLLRQKQEYLNDAIKGTEEKLKTEKEALEQLKASDSFDKNSEQARALERQIIADEQSLKNLKEQSKEFGSVASQQFKLVGDKVKEVGDNISKVGEGMSKKVTAPLVAVGGASVAAFKEVDAGLDIVRKKTGATGEDFEDMEGAVKRLATMLPADFETIGNAVGEVNTRFGATEDGLSDLSYAFIQFAQINDMDVVSAVDDSQKALSAFGLEAADAYRLLDVLNSTGQKTGASMDSLLNGLIQNGTAFQEMGLSIEQATVFMGQMETSGANSETVMQGLRKALKNATEDGIPLNQALSDLQETILNGTGTVDGLTAAYDIFGKSGDQIYAAVKNGTLDFQNLALSAEDAAGSVSSTFEETIDPADQFAMVMNQAKIAGSELGEVLMTALVPLIEKLSGFVGTLTEKFRELSPEQQDMIVKIGGIVAAIGPALMIGGKLISMVGSIITVLGTVIGVLGGPLTIAIGAAIAAGVAIYKNWDKIKETAGKLASSVKEKFDDIKKSITDKINSAKDTVHDAIEKIKGFFKFEWSLPKLKLPHFSMTGEFSLSPPSVPHFSVDWYKKAYQNPVLFTQPTVLQTAAGMKGFGDGAGAEVVMGLNKLKEMVGGENVTINVYGAQGQDVRALAAEVERALVRAQKSRSAVFA